MPERQFAFAADSGFVQVRKAPDRMQSLQFKAQFSLNSSEFCKIFAANFGSRPKLRQILALSSFCNAT
jgi:hypothetical protein